MVDNIYCFRYEKMTQYLHMNAAVACLRHDDPLYHPLAKVQLLVDVVHNNFKYRYSNHREISIDEAMNGFKGYTELRIHAK